MLLLLLAAPGLTPSPLPAALSPSIASDTLAPSPLERVIGATNQALLATDVEYLTLTHLLNQTLDFQLVCWRGREGGYVSLSPTNTHYLVRCRPPITG